MSRSRGRTEPAGGGRCRSLTDRGEPKIRTTTILACASLAFSGLLAAGAAQAGRSGNCAGWEAVGKYNGTNGDLPKTVPEGVKLQQALAEHAGSWVTDFAWTDDNAWERGFKSLSSGGTDSSWDDDVDLTLFAGHGNRNGVFFGVNQDDLAIRFDEAVLGDKDLEWMIFDACQVLKDDWHVKSAWVKATILSENDKIAAYMRADGGSSKPRSPIHRIIDWMITRRIMKLRILGLAAIAASALTASVAFADNGTNRRGLPFRSDVLMEDELFKEQAPEMLNKLGLAKGQAFDLFAQEGKSFSRLDRPQAGRHVLQGRVLHAGEVGRGSAERGDDEGRQRGERRSFRTRSTFRPSA